MRTFCKYIKYISIMKRLFLLMAGMLLCGMMMAQNRVPSTRVSFDFPKGGWKYLETIRVDPNTNVYLYSFSRRAVVGQEGDTVLPNLRIYVKDHYSKTVFDLVMERYMKQPYQSLDEYMDNLPAEGIGYKGYCKGIDDGVEYLFDMIYFKDGNTAFEFRLETTKDTYSEMEDEFEEILNTIVIKK